jgi:hypothetical protein
MNLNEILFDDFRLEKKKNVCSSFSPSPPLPDLSLSSLINFKLIFQGEAKRIFGKVS